MKSSGSQKIMVVSVALFLTLPSAFACSACYGETGAPMTRGLSWAVVALAGIVGAVLTGVAMFFVHVSRRANALEQAEQESKGVSLRD